MPVWHYWVMPKRSSKPAKRPPKDKNQAAKKLVDELSRRSEEDREDELPDLSAEERSLAAAILGRRGGLKGGPARAAKLSARRRKQIARKAARTRWDQPRRSRDRE